MLWLKMIAGSMILDDLYGPNVLQVFRNLVKGHDSFEVIQHWEQTNQPNQTPYKRIRRPHYFILFIIYYIKERI